MGATARTPTSVIKEKVGSMSLWITPFTVIDDTDTYASGHKNSIVMAWCNPTNDPTQTKEGIDITYVLATGAITFNCGEDTRAGNLYILTAGDGKDT